MAAIRSGGTAPALVLRLLGPFEAHLNGVPLARLRSRKGYWLLALLALRAGREIERSFLAGLLWPDHPQVRAFASLRNSLKDLRQALGVERDRLRSPTPRTLTLDPRDADVDLLAFDAAITHGDIPSLEQAVTLYRGPLLEDCAEEWILHEREFRHQAYLQALERLAGHALDRAPVAAERYLRLAIAADPLRESAHRGLMQALAAGGNYAAALATYRELRLLLHRELNAEPDPETRALFDRIRQEAREKAASVRESRVPSGNGGVSRHAGDRDASAPPRLDPRRKYLPAEPTPLVGREYELAAIRAALQREDVRLVTLTGAGGTGKTRLAIEVAAGLLDDFPDGVFFVALAAIRDPQLVLPTVARTLGVPEVGGLPLVESLKAYLSEKWLLLLLDNFEQVLEAAPGLAEILTAAPRLKVLVTSRAVLQLRGEHDISVPPLATPDPADTTSVDALSRYGAVALFHQRAAAVRADFAITDENARAVAEICCRLDGLPLAIELAASRMRLLPPRALLPRLDRRLKLLTGGPRDLPARQQTMRDTLEWSYNLLQESEKWLFRRLAVFVGSCTLEAAEAVCGRACGRAIDVLEGIAALVDQSLLDPIAGADGEFHYRMLETIREYAWEQLAESGELAELRRRHGEFFLALAERLEEERTHASQDLGACLDRIEVEHDNLRAVLDRSVEAGDALLGLRMGGILGPFWETRGHWTEGRERLARLLALPSASTPTMARARALDAAGALACSQGDLTAARALHEESLAIWRELGDRKQIADTLHRLGHVALPSSLTGLLQVVHHQTDLEAARALHTETLALRREIDDRPGIASSLDNLGYVAACEGDYTTARRLYEEALAIWRELDDRWGTTFALHGLSDVACAGGDYETAWALQEECLAMRRSVGDRAYIARSLSFLGFIARRQGNLTAARRFYEESLMLWRDLGNPGSIAWTLGNLARVALSQGDEGTAQSSGRESLRLQQQLRNQQGIAESLRRLAGVAAARGSSERPVQLFAAADAIDEEAPLPPADRAEAARQVAELRAALGEQAFAAAWAQGRAMTLDEAIACALEW